MKRKIITQAQEHTKTLSFLTNSHWTLSPNFKISSLLNPDPKDSLLHVHAIIKVETVTPGPGKYEDVTMMSKKGNYVLSQNRGGTKGKFDAEKR